MSARVLDASACATLAALPVEAQVSSVKTVFIIVMENHNWWANSKAPPIIALHQ